MKKLAAFSPKIADLVGVVSFFKTKPPHQWESSLYYEELLVSVEDVLEELPHLLEAQFQKGQADALGLVGILLQKLGGQAQISLEELVEANQLEIISTSDGARGYRDYVVRRKNGRPDE